MADDLLFLHHDQEHGALGGHVHLPEHPLLAAKGVSFGYAGAPPVLNGADFSLGEERLGLIGANGSGKTTLLHILMGLLRPTSGHVELDSQVVSTEKEFKELRNQVGFVFQNPDDQLFMPTVLEDVAFGPLNQGLPPEEARECAMETLRSLGLAGLEKRITHRLSGGEKRLVSLATVLAMRPRALLLDEPSNDLDPATRDRLVELLNALPQAMCIISHDWDFLDRTVSRLLVMKKGRLESRDAAVLHAHVHAHPGGEADHAHPEHAPKD